MNAHLVQGSDEWFAARVGKVTASRVADIIAKTKSGVSTSRANYMAELVCERLTGIPAERHVSDPMRWGAENEGAARTAYEFLECEKVEQVGLIDHPTISMAAASPDGIVGGVKILEIKCPNTATHLGTLGLKQVSSRHLTQIHWQASCTRCIAADFVSYDPRLPPRMRYICIPVKINQDYIRQLESEVEKFIAELNEQISDLLVEYGGCSEP